MKQLKHLTETWGYPLRRFFAFALVLLLAGGLLFGTASTAFAAEPQIETLKMWQWNRVRNRSDLPENTSYTQILLFYRGSGSTYMLNGSGASVDTEKNRLQFNGATPPWDAMGGEFRDTFYTAALPTDIWLYYEGVDYANGYNNNYGKMYRIHASACPGGIGYDEPYFSTDDDEKWTIITPDCDPARKKDSDPNIADGYVRIFDNVAGAGDRFMHIYGSAVGTNKNTGWDDSQFILYVGKEITYPALKNYTVKSGQVQHLAQGVYIPGGVTITVEKDAILTVSGNLYNGGRIVNRGTLVLEKDACIQPTQWDNEGGLGCDGGDLILLSGARLITGSRDWDEDCGNGFLLKNNASCVNCGTIVTTGNVTLDSGATVENREGGTILVGYALTGAMKGNMHTVSAAEVRTAASYVNPLAAWRLPKDPAKETIYYGRVMFKGEYEWKYVYFSEDDLQTYYQKVGLSFTTVRLNAVKLPEGYPKSLWLGENVMIANAGTIVYNTELSQHSTAVAENTGAGTMTEDKSMDNVRLIRENSYVCVDPENGAALTVPVLVNLNSSDVLWTNNR